MILHYGSEEKTLRCLSSVENAYPENGVLIIENGEKPTTIRPSGERAIQWVGFNAGYSGGMNHGLANAIRFGYEFAYLVANDTYEHDSKTLSALEAMMDSDPRLAFACPTSLDENGKSRTFPLPWMFGEIPIPSDAVLVRLSAMKEIGGYDESFHTYYEDIDLYERASAAKWRARISPDIFVRHPMHKRPSRVSRFREARNFWRYAKKHGLPSSALKQNLRDTLYLSRHTPGDALPWLSGQIVGMSVWVLMTLRLWPTHDPKSRLFERVRDWPIYPLRGGMRHRLTFTKED